MLGSVQSHRVSCPKASAESQALSPRARFFQVPHAPTLKPVLFPGGNSHQLQTCIILEKSLE